MKKLSYQTTPEIQNILDSIGRTEDVKVSPNGRYLALVENRVSKIHFFGIHISGDSQSRALNLSSCITISSECLHYPHGISFLGNDYFVVANREADVVVFEFPTDLSAQGQSQIDLTPVAIAKGKNFYGRISSPGNVDCYQLKENHYRVLVCNNYIDTVVSLDIDISGEVQIKNNGVLIKRDLKLPDGVSVSPDKKWVAVSNHDKGAALIYRLSPFLNRFMAPSVVLEGIACPHGIRFSADGEKLFVTDAGSQFIHIYESNNGNWGKDPKSRKIIKLVDDGNFAKGRINAQGKVVNAEEGGLKGVDIINNEILVTTAEHQVFNVYSVNELVDSPQRSTDRNLLVDQLQEMDLFRKERADHAWQHRVTLKSKIKITVKKLINKWA